MTGVFEKSKKLVGLDDSARVKIRGNHPKSNRGFALGGGKDLFAGDVVEVDALTAAMAVAAGCAEVIEVLDTPAP